MAEVLETTKDSTLLFLAFNNRPPEVVKTGKGRGEWEKRVLFLREKLL